MNENMTGNETIRGEEEVLEVMPLVDILDGADGVTMWFEVPGANSGTVNIEVKNHVMSLNAEKLTAPERQADRIQTPLPALRRCGYRKDFRENPGRRADAEHSEIGT